MAKRNPMPTFIPARASYVQKSWYQCECCFEVVRGELYDHANDLCKACARELVTRDEKQGVGS